MNEDEFEIGGHVYRRTKLNAFEQLHATRRLGPIFGAVAKTMNGQQATMGDALSAAAQPILEALARIPDDDLNVVITTCLRHVARKQDGDRGWAPVHGGGGLMFEDIDMTAMLTIVWRVLEGSLASFFGGLAGSSGQASPAAVPS